MCTSRQMKTNSVHHNDCHDIVHNVIKANEDQVCTPDMHAKIYGHQTRTSLVHIVWRDVPMRPNERANVARCTADECVRMHGLTTEEHGDVPV